MIKLLMIQPENKEINKFRRLQFNNFSQITIPYLAAFVDERKYEITLIDEYSQKIPYSKRFDLVAITVNTPNAMHCYEISRRFRQKGSDVVFGGPHATLLPGEASAHCDYLVAGEAESSWKQFLEDYCIGAALKRYESDRPPSLEGLPAPRWDLLKRSSLMKGAVFASRGCPYSCRYCNLKQIYHDCYRSRPVTDVVSEIKAMRSLFFVFWDDNFFARNNYAKQLLQALAPLKRKWAAQATLKDCNDDGLLRLAKEAGCMYLFVGLESFTEGSLGDAGKAVNRICEYEQAIKRIHSHGIMVQAGIVFGFDSDDASVFAQTLEACERLGIDGVTASILTPFPKTPIYEQYKAQDRLLSEDWSIYNSKTAVAFAPRLMSPEELFEGYSWFRREFYSLKSFAKRMRISKTNVAANFIINAGYKMGINRQAGFVKKITINAVYAIGVFIAVALAAIALFGPTGYIDAKAMLPITYREQAFCGLAFGSLPMLFASSAFYSANANSSRLNNKGYALLVFSPLLVCSVCALLIAFWILAGIVSMLA
ncbi:MAG: B12-binding domain-containing radical SAM protein [Eubacteriaceae bacterium]|nr:B12-binding domain-containing radical SAM protein [Eubacteriaceae bacterium]